MKEKTSVGASEVETAGKTKFIFLHAGFRRMRIVYIKNHRCAAECEE